jgi:hypothetical protein
MYIVPFFDTTKPGNPLRGVAAPIFSFDDMPTTISGAMGTRYAVSVTSQGWEPATNGLNPDDGGASTHRTLFLGTVPWEIVVTETSQITYGEVDSTNDILRIGLTLTGAAAAIVWMMTRLDRRTQRQIKQATADLSHRASHDLLTGLVNRSTLMHSVDAAIATGKPLGVVFLDLDNFKTVNDTYGHRFGTRYWLKLRRGFGATLARSTLSAGWAAMSSSLWCQTSRSKSSPNWVNASFMRFTNPWSLKESRCFRRLRLVSRYTKAVVTPTR